MLAGVTGVKWGSKAGEEPPSIEDEDDEDDSCGIGAGGAGGGIDRSTGEGVSPVTSPATLPLLERVERRRGVELVDFEPRSLDGLGLTGRMAGDCFFREG